MSWHNPLKQQSLSVVIWVNMLWDEYKWNSDNIGTLFFVFYIRVLKTYIYDRYDTFSQEKKTLEKLN